MALDTGPTITHPGKGESSYIVGVVCLGVRRQHLERLPEGVHLFFVIGDDNSVDHGLGPGVLLCVRIHLDLDLASLAASRGRETVLIADERLRARD